MKRRPQIALAIAGLMLTFSILLIAVVLHVEPSESGRSVFASPNGQPTSRTFARRPEPPLLVSKTTSQLGSVPNRQIATSSFLKETPASPLIPPERTFILRRPAASPEVSETSAGSPVCGVSHLETSNDASAKRPEFWIWAGVGENYQFYRQTIPSFSGSANFQNIQGPSLNLMAGSRGENFGSEFSYKQTPGHMSAPSTVTLRNGDYKWQALSAEGLYRADHSPWEWRLGLQLHQMPFIYYDPQASLLDIRSNSLLLATAGFDRTWNISKRLRGEWLLRYQLPIQSGASNGDSFSVTPKLAFDGSIGSIYKLDGATSLGLFWYGQYHDYRFSYSGASTFSGEQTLFYSNVELRVGLEF